MALGCVVQPKAFAAGLSRHQDGLPKDQRAVTAFTIQSLIAWSGGRGPEMKPQWMVGFLQRLLHTSR